MGPEIRVNLIASSGSGEWEEQAAAATAIARAAATANPLRISSSLPLALYEEGGAGL